MSKTKEKISPIVLDGPQPESFLPEYQPVAGYYHLAKLDLNGNEIPGTDVSISPSTFNRTFKALTEGEKPTYILKKNHKQ